MRWDVGGPLGFGNNDVSMNSFLAPYKGGLLWWSSAHHDQGAFGRPYYCFWRRLGYTGPWTVVNVPREFAANAFAFRTAAHDNDEIIMACGGGMGADNIPQARQKYFWRLI